MHAYDLLIEPTPYESQNPDHAGWVFGRPRGIEERHWPLDPTNGFPLMHGFTLRLPDDHRVHGPEIVGLSFFAVDGNHNDGGPVPGLNVPKLLADHPDTPPDDEELEAIWRHAREEHPRLHRMQDILGSEYAVILLTEEEFTGEVCAAPDWTNSIALADTPLPSWLERGNGRSKTLDHLEEELGGLPSRDFDFERAIRCSVRAHDPNAGIPAEDDPDESSAYTSPFDPETYDRLGWAEAHADNHIGGTMNPVQNVPDMSPHYIGFEESFGDYNFGSGNAQLDFLNMKIDWAC